jgi:uncharacterized protein (UPF0332 family)
MSFNWLDYLTLSKKLQSDPAVFGLQEASLRSAISRAYYAAFQYAMILAVKKGYLPKHNGTDHITLPDFFKNYKPEPIIGPKISQDLDRLRVQRGHSDYEVSVPNINKFAQLAISWADSIIVDVDSIAR